MGSRLKTRLASMDLHRYEYNCEKHHGKRALARLLIVSLHAVTSMPKISATSFECPNSPQPGRLPPLCGGLDAFQCH